jgi:hypothetical protein
MNRFDAGVRWREGGLSLSKIAGQKLNEALARREVYAAVLVTALVERIGEKYFLQPTVEALRATLRSNLERHPTQAISDSQRGLIWSSVRR